MYLAPRNWRKGIERLLCQRSEEMLASRHYAQVVLWVFEGNRAARRFYEAMGFVTDGASQVLSPGAPLISLTQRFSGTSPQTFPPGFAP